MSVCMNQDQMPELPEATHYGYADVPRLTDEEIYAYARAYAEQAVLAERELCVKVCEDWASDAPLDKLGVGQALGALHCADLIRARR